MGGPRKRTKIVEDEVHIGRRLDEVEEVDTEEEEDLSRWRPFFRPYTPEERRILVSKAVQVALETCFHNHIYQCENELYCQKIGGGIGTRVTGVVDRISMDVWADRMATCLDSNDIHDGKIRR